MALFNIHEYLAIAAVVALLLAFKIRSLSRVMARDVVMMID